ncbi:SLC13 family permease [Candidatus Uabimicrobium sp. HlEnr_7]|uniref:SLC13 family permease n=1 Tax=Candidatus Uabimicrobium helgolandensis TaxID=3095367 RepID=UPI003558C8E8
MKKIGFVLGIFLFAILLYWSYSFEIPPEGSKALSPQMIKVLAVAVLMACWWVSEAIPIPATSLIPLAAFPLLDIMGTKQIGPAYGDRMVLLLMGGFFIATVIEKVNLHRRIALNVICRVGTNPRQLLLGFMIATAALSMWISNTATTLMMLPIALAVVTQLEKKFEHTSLAAAFLLSIAYAASIGGVGTPIGTPPNLIMMQNYEKTRRDFLQIRPKNIINASEFLNGLQKDTDPAIVKLRESLTAKTQTNLQQNDLQEKLVLSILVDINKVLAAEPLVSKEQLSLSEQKQLAVYLQNDALKFNRLLLETRYPQFLRPHRQVKEISFASWMAVGIPTVIILLFIMWLYMIYMFKLPKSSDKSSEEVLQKEIQDLGGMSRDEKATAVLFLITSLLWIFRKNIDLGFVVIPGWSSFFGLPKCDDTTVAIFMALVMFSFPMENGKKLLDWPTAKKIPWGMLLLFGGGIALARAFDHTGLSQWLGENLQQITVLPTIVVMLILCTFMTFLTEVTSNTAVTNVIMPILGITAVSIDANPALLMMPAAISASFAFMLPVATAPNAIMYGSERFSIATMAKTGFMLNVIGIFVVTTLCYLLGTIFIF